MELDKKQVLPGDLNPGFTSTSNADHAGVGHGVFSIESLYVELNKP